MSPADATLVERLRRMMFVREAFDEPHGTYEQPCDEHDHGAQAVLCNPDGPEAADRISALEAEVVAARECIQLLEDDQERTENLLADPAAVHINMLRGGIAKPSLDNIKHIYPELREAEARALVLERERDEAREKLREAAETMRRIEGLSFFRMTEPTSRLNEIVRKARAFLKSLESGN